MASLGKKFLSAFVDIEDDHKDKEPVNTQPDRDNTPEKTTASHSTTKGAPSEKFKTYFDTLFKDSNLPGPDYFEFAKMVEAMSAIPDEKTKFATAFAGLSIQGLDKAKLLSTANQYMQLLDDDAKNFHATVDKALQEKVIGKKKEMEEKAKRVQALTREITDLNNELQLINNEIKENEEKINANSGSYRVELENMKIRINQDLQKINQYIA